MTNHREWIVLVAVPPEHPLAGQFAAHGLAVVEVHTAALAVAWARAKRPDAIIPDLDLPDMNGLDVCRVMRGMPGIADQVPILILTHDQPTPGQRASVGSRSGEPELETPRIRCFAEPSPVLPEVVTFP